MPEEKVAGSVPRPADTPPCEIELKLVASPQALEQLRKSGPVVGHARNRGIVRRLHAVYYDTPDRSLARDGLSLRVRRSGRRHVMTVKRAAAADPLVRAEWEAVLPDARPDPALLPLAEIGAPLSDLPKESLEPVFVTDVRRRVQRLDLAGAQIEFAFDEGVIEAGDRSEPIGELELELKAGEPAALYEFALALLQIASLRLEVLSKAERGQALASGEEPAVRKAVPVALSASDDVDAAVAAILGNIYGHLLGNLAAAARGGRPEAVHQIRVALRRLRSALSLFRRELDSAALAELSGQARLLSHVLGPARNWDVFATQTVPKIAGAGLDDARLDTLATAAAPHRAASYAAMRETLAGPDVNRFLLTFGALLGRRGWHDGAASEIMTVLAEPAPVFASRLLARAHRKALRRGRRFRKLSPEARHDLRLALKKLRYTVEFFLPLHAGASGARKYLARLESLQEVLGLANDVATTRGLLDILRRENDASALHFAAGAVLGWQRRAEREGARRLRKAWRSFKATTPFWE